jgi:hypothetical protein
MIRYKATVNGNIPLTSSEEVELELKESAWAADTDARAAEEVRTKRNVMLAESDWTQAKDIPDSISTPWAAYRQALRDVPQQAGFPASIAWPEKP